MPMSLKGETLWDVSEPQPSYVWVACCTRPEPGHARPVHPARLNDPTDELLCEVCRLPQRLMSKTAVERYQKGDRRCGPCRTGDHALCTGVGCYRCPRELHRRVGVTATRTPGPRW
jgi:hypothetical protein